jgi:16S rRNA (cytidine1402-2'-O)-methyltransferase
MTNSLLTQSGILYVVATPIGNLADISRRAVEILQQVELIAAEDTRHSKVLLNHLNINCPLISLHQFNEQKRCQTLVKRLQQGGQLALISDAGTPLISDPGYRLVQQVKALNIKVSPIPGPCALISALSIAGFSADRFVFEGFLPSQQRARQQRLAALSRETRTLVFYESCHRIMACLGDLATCFNQRPLVVARELTKEFETLYHGCAEDIYQQLASHSNHQRGEFVIVSQGAATVNNNLTSASRKTLEVLLTELPLKQAVKLAATISGENKNQLYQYALHYQTKETHH